MKPPLIIGLAGRARVGKNSIGDRFAIAYGAWTLAFTEPLYDGIEATFGIHDIETLDKDEPRVEFNGLSLRAALQRYGDWIRGHFGADILIRLLGVRMIAAQIHGNDFFLVTDVRTKAEIDWIRERGGAIWWVSRPSAPGVEAHGTEFTDAQQASWRHPDDVEIVNDGSFSDLLANAEAAFNSTLRKEFSA